jgi:hypothetical protein
MMNEGGAHEVDVRHVRGGFEVPVGVLRSAPELGERYQHEPVLLRMLVTVFEAAK